MKQEKVTKIALQKNAEKMTKTKRKGSHQICHVLVSHYFLIHITVKQYALTHFYNECTMHYNCKQLFIGFLKS